MSVSRPKASKAKGSGAVPGPWPAHPVIYELSTLPWLNEVAARCGHPGTLADVPAAEWDALALPGVDAVWLMGVWERSPVGREIALGDEGIRAQVAQLLPDATDADIVGSPYCIRRYRVDAQFGGPDGLAAARGELAKRGVRLLLDFVPNHVAPDHEWVESHPEYFVRGTAADLGMEPPAFLETAGGVLAMGRDPYFPPWPDVVQLDPTQAALRSAVIATLSDVAAQCDGVRCDMAMLLLDDVVAQTWGDRVGPPGPAPYWSEVTEAVKKRHPDFLFVAEAYWDREPDLLAQGFDHCYDKRLYDRLAVRRRRLGAGPPGGRSRLPATSGAVLGESRRTPVRRGLPRGPWGGGRRGGRHRTGSTPALPRSIQRPQVPYAGATRSVAGRAARRRVGGPMDPPPRLVGG